MNSAKSLLTSSAHEEEIRFVLFDLDSGFAIGDEQRILVQLFTSNPFEAFCRLKDYLCYRLGMDFTPEQVENCFSDPHPEDLKFGDSYLALGFWHGKEFGIQFATPKH